MTAFSLVIADPNETKLGESTLWDTTALHGYWMGNYTFFDD